MRLIVTELKDDMNLQVGLEEEERGHRTRYTLVKLVTQGGGYQASGSEDEDDTDRCEQY